MPADTVSRWIADADWQRI